MHEHVTQLPAVRPLLAAVAMSALLLAFMPPAAAETTAPGPVQGDDGTAVTAQDSPIELERLSGQTRFQTAAEIATARFAQSDEVVIATGQVFADALAGAALEGTLEAPVLLVPSDLVGGSIPGEITDAIDDLGATNATLLGGTTAISSDVEDYLVANSSVATTDRVSGATRFETAEEIAEAVPAGPLPQDVRDEHDLDGENGAFLATGLNWPDSLAGGAGAYAGPHPILLTTADELHNSAAQGLDASGADVVFILGGTAVVGTGVEAELEAEGYEVVRLSGADRWETATEVADAFADDFDFGVADVGLATGFQFADALASAPYLGEVPAPLVLTPTNETHATTEGWFEARGCDVETIHIFGGQAAVAQSTAEAYAEAACPDDPVVDPEPETMTVSIDPETLTVGETATATAEVTGDDNEPFEGAEVDFTTEHSDPAGTVDPVDGDDVTDADGEATFAFTTPETGTVTVTAETDGLSASAEATFVAPEPVDFAGIELLPELELVETSVLFDQGDVGAEGSIDLTFDAHDNTVDWELEADNLSSGPTGSPLHIHDGSWLENGPVVIDLVPDAAELDVTEDPIDGTFSVTGDGTVEADSEVIDEILEDPTGYYANFHTDDYPAGAIRNQVDDSEVDLPEPLEIVAATQTAAETATVSGTVDPRVETVTVELDDDASNEVAEDVEVTIDVQNGVDVGVWETEVDISELEDGDVFVLATGYVENDIDLGRQDFDSFEKGPFLNGVLQE